MQRKDFFELTVHHVATLALLFFSYAVNFWRVGTLVMVVHDVADIVLEGAKSLNYSGMRPWTRPFLILSCFG